MNTLTYAGTNLNTFGVWFDSSRKYKKPAKRYLGFDVPARNGTLYASEHKFDNVVIEYRCYIKENFATNYNNLINFLNSFDTYQVLENSVDNTVYRLALFHEELSVDTGQFLKDGQFSLFFDCKPQAFLKTGDTELEIQSETTTKTGNPITIDDPYGVMTVTSVVADLDPTITGYTEVNVAITGGSTFTTSLGTTVYGGTLNLTTGVLTVDKGMFVVSGGMSENSNWSNTTTIAVSGNVLSPVADSSKINTAISSTLVNATTLGISTAVGGNSVTSPCFGLNSNQSNAGYLYLRLPKATCGSTAAAVNTWLSSNPITVVYPLYTPQTYQLTPQQISLLTGTNVITCDSGDMTITLAYPYELENPSYMESKPIFKLDNETSIILNGETVITYPSVLAVTDKTVSGQGYQIKASNNVFTYSGNVPSGTYDFPCTLLPEGTYKFFGNSNIINCSLVISNGTNRVIYSGHTFTIADDDVSMSVRIHGGTSGAYTIKPTVTLGTVFVNCELMDCYREDGTNANPYVQLTDGFIVLPKGKNYIEATGTAYVMPKWWRL